MTLIDYDKLKYEFDEKCVGDCGCCDESNCPVFNQTEISLEEHDAKVRADAIEELKSKADCKNSDCYNCAMADGDMNCMLGLLELEE